MGRMKSSDIERNCEIKFMNTGPWWHLYTPGRDTPIIFTDAEDFLFAMNLMARCAFEVKRVVVVAFELMDNHLHVVLMGSEDDVELFFCLFRRRLSRYLKTVKKVGGLTDRFRICLKPVNDLKGLRNLIVYVHRNGYVVDSDVTPFSYKWGTGRHYYNDFPINRCLSDLTFKERRILFRSGDLNLPGDYKVLDGYISPTSFCSIGLGMSMFRDAHHYFLAVTKSVESYSELAVELDDGEFLSDQELFRELFKIIRTSYGISSSRDLTKAQRLDLARTLHFKYRSSNGQIRRLLNLSPAELEILFPVTKS